MQVLGCLFFVILAVVLFVICALLVIIQRILSVFGIQVPWFKFIKPETFNYSQQRHNEQIQSETTTAYSTNPEQTEKKKIFTDDEGEYVEFEEVKD